MCQSENMNRINETLHYMVWHETSHQMSVRSQLAVGGPRVQQAHASGLDSVIVVLCIWTPGSKASELNNSQAG